MSDKILQWHIVNNANVESRICRDFTLDGLTVEAEMEEGTTHLEGTRDEGSKMRRRI